MTASTTGGESNWRLRIVLAGVVLLCSIAVTVINFATHAGAWSYISLVCAVALAVAIVVALLRHRSGG